MAKRSEIYKCNICENIVHVLSDGKGTLYCCNAPMDRLIENTVDAAKEKHIPVFKKIQNKLKIQVGSIAHPMETDHFIEWVEMITKNRSFFRFFEPGETAETFFNEKTDSGILIRAYCNLHGLWKNEKIDPE